MPVSIPGVGTPTYQDWAEEVAEWVNPTAWTAPALTNSWVNFGSGFQVMQYRKVGDTVELRGLIKSGASGTVAFTLPDGFRPPAQVQLLGGAYTAMAAITIATTGTVTITSTSTAGVVVHGSFSTI